MTISFGKFIPVKVYIDGREIKNNAYGNVPKEVERATLTLCDCLTKDKNYPNSYLAEQQRRYFASKIDDYKIPIKSPANKTDILPSSVKTANIEGQRYLVTGSDIKKYKDEGYQLGVTTKAIKERAEDAIGAEADFTSWQDFNERVNAVTSQERQIAKQDRINSIKQHIIRNERVNNETLCIQAVTNPDYVEGKSPKRDKYRIALIDFVA